MKIAHIVSTPPFAWGTGGSARVVYDQAKALALKGHEVSVISTDIFTPNENANVKKNPEIVDGFNLYRFPCISSKLAWKYKIYASFSLISYVKKQVSDYDIIHLHDLISIHAIMVMHNCIKNQIPYVITPHGSVPWLNEKKFINRTYARIFGIKILKNASKVTALTTKERDQLIDCGVDVDNIVIIPNGIDPLDYVNFPTRGRFKKQFGITTDKKVVLYIGRINKIKGLELLIEAFGDLLAETKDVVLALVGPDDGFLRDVKNMVKTLGIESSVILTGPLFGAEKMQALADADLFILPSHYEAFGISLIEAMVCRIPIIVTTGCAISDVVKEGGLVVGHDAKELKGAMEYLLDNDDIRISCGKNGLDIVLEKFNWATIIEKIETLYELAIHDSGRKTIE